MKKKEETLEFKLPMIPEKGYLASLSYAELQALCAALRHEIIEACSKKGGHLSSNLGDVELIVALHRAFSFPEDKLIFDVGHQCYAHKLLSGRSLENLNDSGGIAGFQKRKESPYDPWEAGHSSTSISAAIAYAITRDKNKENFDVIAFIGDASIANGLSFEALNDLGQRQQKVIVVLNDNDMSISPPSGGLSRYLRKISTGRIYTKMKKGYHSVLMKTHAGQRFYNWTARIKDRIKHHLVRTTFFENLGFNYIGPINGHDIKAIEKALIQAKRSTRPVILHALTQKGRGYRYAEGDTTGYWHGVTPFDIETGRPKNLHPGMISWSHFFADLTLEIMGAKEKAEIVVPATLKGSGLEKVFATYGDRAVDVGIAEEHAATLCGGLAVNGMHPILIIYSTFLQRAYDEIAHDCARMKANMTVLVERAGLVGHNGDTHQGIYDVAYLKSIPGVTVAMPSDASIARALYYQSFDDHGVFCIRYPRELIEENQIEKDVYLPYLRFRYEGVSKAKKMAVIAVGPKEKEILNLAKANYLDVEIIDPVYLCPLQKDNVLPLLSYESIYIYDAYSTNEGFASSLSALLMEEGYRGKVYVRAIPNVFVEQASLNEQLGQFGLLPAQVIAEIKTLLK